MLIHHWKFLIQEDNYARNTQDMYHLMPMIQFKSWSHLKDVTEFNHPLPLNTTITNIHVYDYHPLPLKIIITNIHVYDYFITYIILRPHSDIIGNSLCDIFTSYIVTVRRPSPRQDVNRAAYLPTFLEHSLFNSLRPNDAYMHQENRPSLLQIMACCLFGAKPLSVPMLEYC